MNDLILISLTLALVSVLVSFVSFVKYHNNCQYAKNKMNEWLDNADELRKQDDETIQDLQKRLRDNGLDWSIG